MSDTVDNPPATPMWLDDVWAEIRAAGGIKSYRNRMRHDGRAKRRRERIATAVLAALIIKPDDRLIISATSGSYTAVAFADALIAELDKE